MTDSQQTSLFEITGKTVTVWADGSCRRARYPDGTAGYGCVIRNSETDEVEEIQGQAEYDDRPSVPVAEYKAIINGVEWVCNEYSEVGVLQVYSDAETPVEQVKGNYNIRSPSLLKLKREAYRLLSRFDEWHINWQSETQSPEIKRADELAKGATRGDDQ